MTKKRVIVPLFLSLVLMLTLAILPTVKADEMYYTWDSATHGTDINAPFGQIGSEADAYADATGLTKVFAYGGIGFWGTLKRGLSYT